MTSYNSHDCVELYYKYTEIDLNAKTKQYFFISNSVKNINNHIDKMVLPEQINKLNYIQSSILNAIEKAFL